MSPALDERVDVAKSPRAAAHYRRDLYTQFGEWKLAFAAYNSGEHAVQRALQHGGRDFEALSRGRQLPFGNSQLRSSRTLGGASAGWSLTQTGAAYEQPE